MWGIYTDDYDRVLDVECTELQSKLRKDTDYESIVSGAFKLLYFLDEAAMDRFNFLLHVSYKDRDWWQAVDLKTFKAMSIDIFGYCQEFASVVQTCMSCWRLCAALYEIEFTVYPDG